MKILVLDNYDSFTYNLVHYLEKVSDHTIHVHRNDQVTVEEAAGYEKILISPGPGLPRDAGILPQLIQRAKDKSILGVCLGHQAIAEAFGGSLVNLERVHHGVAVEMQVSKDDPLFAGLPSSFPVGRYHSWAVNAGDMPADLEVLAVDAAGIVMAMRHKYYNIRSVQFHPESVLTEHGEQMLRNWLERC